MQNTSRIRQLLSRFGLKVYGGPFAGLKYISSSHGSTLGPKLLGSYELEIVSEINTAILANPGLIIDVGAAEGYYAVGLASRLPKCKVIAYEASERGRALLSELAILNQVQRQVEIQGYCDSATFLEVINNHSVSLMIMDVEGGEDQLLSEEAASLLKSTVVIVEIHEFACAGVGERLRQRFSKTHCATEINSSTRRISDVSKLWLRPIVWLFKMFGRDYLSERRPSEMSWLILRPRNSV